jgi:hypothetical protein
MREAVASRITADDAIVSREDWNPMVPEGGVTAETVLDQDGLMRLPWIGEVVVYDMRNLAIGVRDKLA